jgi:ankyrin repeat protein
MAVVHLLLRHGADPNARVSVPPDGGDERYAEFTALHLAAAHTMEDVGLAHALLQSGATVDARNADGVTPLQLAAACSFSITRLLLEAGASPLLRSHDGCCALDELAYCKRTLDCYNTSWGYLERTDVPAAAG